MAGARERWDYAWRLTRPKVKRPGEVVGFLLGLGLALGLSAVFAHSTGLVLAGIALGGGVMGAVVYPTCTFVAAFVTEPRRVLQDRVDRLERATGTVSADPQFHALKRLHSEGKMLRREVPSSPRLAEIQDVAEGWAQRCRKELGAWPPFLERFASVRTPEHTHSRPDLKNSLGKMLAVIDIALAHLKEGGR